jgi:hypothetical protein
LREAKPLSIAELPGAYFRLLSAELPTIAEQLATTGMGDLRALEEGARRRHFPSAVLAAAVAYAKQHPSNLSYGDAAMLSLALRIGDVIADACEAGTFTQRLDHHRDTYMWLEAYRVLEGELGEGQRGRWRRELERNIAALASTVAERVEYARYQSPFIYTSPGNQFYLDRQGHVSVFHEALGLIITGANSKRQPELATFSEQVRGELCHLPTSSRLQMSDAEDRLSLAYNTFFADLRVPTPTGSEVTLRFTITAHGRVEDARLALQLCLKAGEELETERTRVLLGEARLELSDEETGGWIRHHGWKMRVPPQSRLMWPVFPFNPYANGPETSLEQAVGVLTVPIQLPPRAEGGGGARTQELGFTIEAGGE